MATATAAAKGPKEFTFTWEGKDKAGKTVRGELRAPGEAMVNATLRRQGIVVSKVKKQSNKGGGKIGRKDIALFTRQPGEVLTCGADVFAVDVEPVGGAPGQRRRARHGVQVAGWTQVGRDPLERQQVEQVLTDARVDVTLLRVRRHDLRAELCRHE